MKKVFLIPLAGLLLGYQPARAQQRVGIGIAAPTEALDVKDTLRVRLLKPPGANQLLVALPDGTLGVSPPLEATAGLGLYAQVAGTNPVTLGPTSGVAFTRVAAAGRYVFVAGGSQLKVYDAQNAPTVPAYTGNNPALSGPVGALAASGSALYAATTAGLDIFTFSGGSTLGLTPQPTVALAPAGTTSTNIYDAVLAGRYLYVAARFSSSSSTVVRVFDLNTPAQPTAVATLPLGLTGRVQLAADNSRGNLLVAPDAGPYKVYALATPTAPTPAQLATTPATAPAMPIFAGGLVVVGGVLYGANNGVNSAPPTLDVYDEASPADPSQPAALGAVRLPQPVQDLAVAGEYAYLLTAITNQLVAVRVAAPALVGLDAAGSVASVAPVLPPTDNLGNHTATQNLNLAGLQLVGNGGSQGLSLDASGRVGVLMAPNGSYRLDVGGALRTTSASTPGTLAAPTLTASTSLSTPNLLAPMTGTHPALPAATGQVSGTGSNPAGSGNYSVTRTGAGSYRLTFTAGPLATGNLQAAAFLAALVGTPGFVTFTASSSSPFIDVYTRSPNGTLTDRDFTFSVFLP